ncbi:protein WBSCR14 homolog [Drosophila ficusphila]|uniref:protein WBSCR14 homolog n=1 Tax=Drosophila ficusphila TaxID=30025 RepID=UPI0007E85C96|nr:protein WBSCR14 homolog [Drosophila ficusphila]XP_017048907.1 protein WBSCR14 homolog [Drosophila ficusphila]XP_017048908.1 protein WBSCR14 homolog [Drosophila ficusphila]
MMLNKYEGFQRTSQMFPHQQQHQLPQLQQQQPQTLSLPHNFPHLQYGAGAVAPACPAESTADLLKAERESIHSGQFMVSHFEAEEAQDDLEDDGEVKMLDPEDPELGKPGEPANTCRDVQLYVPQTVAHFSPMDQEGDESSMSMVASHLEIETSLTKLFKCMNLAYSQKLTSPKWNHFKGVRLRWKDKIRLNNVIWRCWHMQFIQKRRTPVCQFASPLDVDIHSNPQTVVLEGKYWKRHSAVIKAEYRKWRRNYRSKATGCLTYDSKSELDFLEWSPLNDRNLMPDDWTTDTLFSAINVPFPFPDSREIARGAGIADFIQPSLGPLQPNLDDIDITFSDLISTTRLPPVPEEGTDAEMLKNDEYCLSAIVGAPHTLYCNDSVMDVVNSSNGGAGNVDASMLELNTPINSMSYSEVEQRFSVARQVQQPATDPQLLGDPSSMPARMHGGKHFGAVGVGDNSSNRCIINGRVAKSTQRPFRREPHNYDKAQPTLHQTNLYQQMLAEQQKNQQQQHVVGGVVLQASFQSQQQQQQQQHQPQQQQQQLSQQQHFPTQQANAFNNQSFMSGYSDNYQQQQQQQHQQQLNVKVEPLHADVLSLLNDGGYNSIGYKPYPQFKKSASTGTFLNVPRLPQQQQQLSYLQQEPPQMQQSLPLGLSTQQLLQLSRQQQASNTQQTLHQSTVASLLQQPQQQQSHQQPQQQQPTVSTATWVSPNTVLPKEIHRSNSLPLNVSLNKLPDGRQLIHEQPFAVPKYHAKGKSRVRSNSMHQQHTSVVAAAGAGSSSLGSHSCSNLVAAQQATSDPMLNSTLAQLLTSNSRLQTAVANSSPSNSSAASAIATTSNSSNVSPALYANVTTPLSVPVPTQQHSPKKSSSLPMAINPALHSPPGGSRMHSFGPTTANLGSNSLSLSPDSPFHESQDSPLSPTASLKYQPRDTQRRAGHIHAEQKRRYNIKNGFDTLHALIPQLQQNPNAKLSKAAMLQKGADHIKQLRQERNVLKDKIEALRMERDELNNSLTHLHSILPANGAPVTRQGTEHVRQLYEIYVRYNTVNDWKFWILGLILEPLLASYTSTVSSASLDELRRTAFLWVDQHCSLIDLRPAVTNKLKYLSMHTDIVSDPPSTLQEEVAKALQISSGQHPNLHGP